MMEGFLDDFADFPEFVPDVENSVPSNCSYACVEAVSPLICGLSLSILMLNIRSCKKNFDQFIENFQNCILKFSCIILTETWLTSGRDNIFDISGYHCHDLYRNQYGGGIKLYVKNCVKSKVLNNFTMLNNLPYISEYKTTLKIQNSPPKIGGHLILPL